MKTSDFDYVLPEELIAQVPVEPRTNSRLMVLNKATGTIEHRKFYNITDFLNEGDCLVLNNTKVLPARLYGKIVEKDTDVEILLLKYTGNSNIWETLVKPGKKIKKDTNLVFEGGILSGKVIKILESGNRLIKFNFSCTTSDGNETNFYDILEQIGKMPVPHYIKEELKDRDRYQTVYAKTVGSVAAPTAGLHFTNDLLNKIKQKGVKIVHVTLHVGLGTFRPVKVDNIKDHKMHTEWYTIPEESAKIINETKANGKRVICVGTTSCRTLESVFKKYGKIKGISDETDIFIYPGFNFNITDGLITNFHLPKSTLIMLVCAFAGKDCILNAYKTAVENKYRFYSLGDAMFVF